MTRHFAILITCALSLSACTGRVAPNNGTLAELRQEANHPQVGAAQPNGVDGERFDPIADQAITSEALVAWRTAVKHDKQENLTDEQWAHARYEDERLAIQQLEDLAQRYPDSSYIKMMMGQVKHHFKKDTEAAGYYEEAMAKNRHDPLLTFKLAEAKRVAGKHKDAIKYYREVLKMQPDFEDAKVQLAGCLIELEPGSQEGSTLLDEVLEAHPQHEAAVALKKKLTPAKK